MPLTSKGRKRIELTGSKIGTFTVIEYSGNKKWKCRCDCGFKRDAFGACLRSGVKPICLGCDSRIKGARIREKAFINRDIVAYLAGIIDGEGCIRLAKRGKYITPSLQISNTNLNLLNWLIDNCGGAIYKSKVRGNRKQAFVWSVAGQIARDIIESVKPFLIIKNGQADIVLKSYRTFPRKASRDILGRLTTVITDVEVSANNKAVDDIRRLNKRGVETCH